MTTIKLKNGSGAPLAGDLVAGEPALDLTNKRLYTEDSGGTVIEVGTNPTSLTTGTFTSTGIDDNAASTAITIDGSQNVGIGTNPDNKLHVYKGASGHSWSFDSGDGFILENSDSVSINLATPSANSANILFSDADARGQGRIVYAHGSDYMGFHTAGIGNERMRIDSSGNLLVGTTTTDGGYDESDGGASTTFMGASIGGAANGSAFVSRRAAPLQLNRQANDGDIAVFRKNGTTVGSIGTFNSVPYFAGQNANAGGFRIDSTGSNGVIIPTTNTGANRDAATDLGYSSGGTNIRFRDLYLSNSVVVTTATNGTSLLDLGDTADSDIGRIAYDNSVDAMYFQTNNSERMRIDSSGNVGLGTTDTNSHRAAIDSGAGTSLGLMHKSSNSFSLMTFKASGTTQDVRLGVTGNDLLFQTNATERMRIDSSGNLLVGKTATGIGTVGAELKSTGELLATVNNDACAFLNRKSSDGDIIQLRKDGTTVGSIGSRAGNLFTTYTSNGYGLTGTATSNAVIPSFNGATSDNAVDLGGVAVRFDDIYATNGTIQTSDRNEKQDIEALSDAEQRVAVACKGLLRKFRWIDSVEEKGDDARIHFGIIAQDLQDAFTAEGLDAGRYAMFISTTWWESTEVIPAVEAQEAVVDEEGNVIEEAVEAQEERTVVNTYDTAEEAPEGSVERTRLGVRYPQLLAFIIAAI
jgi:hypothetical protein